MSAIATARRWPALLGVLDRARTIAPPGFNRWLVPPAALAIHLCIGMAYGFSVFWLPLSRAVGLDHSVPCAAGTSLFAALFATSCDWKVSDLGWMYTLFFVFLGSSAALWGGWLERVGPRKAGFVAALCWCGGLWISAIGVATHQLWLMAGVRGDRRDRAGPGIHLAGIDPDQMVSGPSRHGNRHGNHGFGGGAMIGAPLADMLMETFRTANSVGVWQTFVVMGAIYFLFMMAGAFGYRVPPAGWQLDAATPGATGEPMITAGQVDFRNAHKTPQFWLLWAVLCLNVSAGIGVIGMASPMLQEIFGGSLIGVPEIEFGALDDGQRRAVAAIAAGFAGLLSLFNIAGRIFWASLSDKIGRKTTYAVFFALGIALYAAVPWTAHLGSQVLFVLALAIIVSMYGGGFATIPAYLADIFGAQFVGAIHGRLLTAWATAGIIGPVVVNYLREAQMAAGLPPHRVYDRTMYILAGMLGIGLVCNMLVRPVASRWLMTEKELAALHVGAHPAADDRHGSFGVGPGGIGQGDIGPGGIGPGRIDIPAAFAWLAVGAPILWGVWLTLRSALALFRY